ncbi:MAG: CerR family C-terminal domain-containing protein [Pirellulales bacterium]|nr:CerR family C-terminal domain-containing protein [Pirellulales bacterium]
MAAQADDTRHRLLEAAGEVFAEKGFQAATVRDICGRAGANLAAVNYHFGDKERLYVEVVKHAHHCGEEIAYPQWPPGTRPRKKFRDYVSHMLIRLLDPRRPAWHTQLMAREMAQPSAACAALVESYIRSGHELLEEILVELMPPETSAIARHLAAFSIVGQCLYFRIGRPIVERLVGEDEFRTYDVARLTDHIVRFSLAALGSRQPAGEASQPASTAGRSREVIR